MVIEPWPLLTETRQMLEAMDMNGLTTIKRQRYAQMASACLMLFALSMGVPSSAHATTGEGSEQVSSPSLFERAKDGVVRGAEAAGNGIQRGASAAAHGVERGIQATARALERGAQATGRGLHKAAEKLGLADSPAE